MPFPVGTAADGATMMSGGGTFPGSMAPVEGAMQAAELGEAGGWSLANPYILPAILAGTYFAPQIAGMFDKDKWQTEQKRLEELAKKGVKIPQQLGATLPQGQGRSTDELAQIEQAKAAQGMYSNETFARSRNVADLKPEDIWGYSAFFDKFGNDWLEKFSEQQRRDIAQAALNAGAVNEHHGTIDVDFDKIPELQDLISGKTTLNTPAQPGVNVQPGQTAQPGQAQPNLDAERQKTVDAINATFKSAADRQQALMDRGAKINMAMKSQEIGRNLLAQNQQKLGNIQYPTPQATPMPTPPIPGTPPPAEPQAQYASGNVGQVQQGLAKAFPNSIAPIAVPAQASARAFPGTSFEQTLNNILSGGRTSGR